MTLLSFISNNKLIPKFKIGDCFEGIAATTNPNGIAKRSLIDKVIAINYDKETYDFALLWKNSKDKYEELASMGYFKNDDTRSKVDCPQDHELQK